MVLYRIVLLLTLPWALPLAALFLPKVRCGLGLRIRRSRAPDWLGKEPTVWVHCASGEFEYAKPVIDLWKRGYPNHRIVVSYFSPTYQGQIQRHATVDWSFPLPIDLPGPVRSMLLKVRPSQIWIARTDSWPELLHQAKILEIPTTLFSATLTESPKRLKKLWLRFSLKSLTQIACVAEGDRKNLKSIFPENAIFVCGDQRFDQVIKRLQSPKALREELLPSDASPDITTRSLVMVAGSTWPEDETVLLPALAAKISSGDLRLIMIPHEPSEVHLRSLESKIRKMRLSSARYSVTQSWAPKQILLVDKLGILAELYQWGQLAFVGGSFRGSVHSVMEPLAAGCLTIVGRHYKNNREAVEFSGTGEVRVAKDQRDLTRIVEEAFLDVTDWPSHKVEIIKKIEARAGASERLIQVIERLPTSRVKLDSNH